VGEAISASTGGVNGTVSTSSARIFSLIAGKKTRQTRGYVDQVAAQIILQNYLDSRAQQKAQAK
jgi:RNase H-fold protein (predicted Holliday junction resolvase)